MKSANAPFLPQAFDFHGIVHIWQIFYKLLPFRGLKVAKKGLM